MFSKGIFNTDSKTLTDPTEHSFYMIDNNTKYQHRITLLALGNVEFDILRHTHGRKDIEVVKVETRCAIQNMSTSGFPLRKALAIPISLPT
jgi:hypothetical protein